MPPKLQSSFIPKGPIVSGVSEPFKVKRSGEHSLLGFLGGFMLTLSVVSAVGVFGYKFYLNYSIENMKVELEAGREALQTETLGEITRLNSRLQSAETLVNRHVVVSPLFKFLDASTLRTVRFSDFTYKDADGNQKVIITGEAKSYASLALQADILNKSEFFKEPVFKDLHLDERGNVAFTFEASVNPKMLSYKKEIEKIAVPVIVPTTSTSTATSTSTSTPTR